jgi:putative chitinase
MTITLEQFKQIFGEVKDAEEIVKQLNNILPTFDINTKDRIAAFIAQVGHESGNFKAKVENLNYSAKALLATFPKYFNAATADLYQRQPEKIANRVYANRMGNHDESSGDGWKYRGRGFLQLTGKNNYTACGADIGKDLGEDPSYLETTEGAITSACWFWKTNKLNDIADKKDIKALTKRINGGFIGLEHRTELYNKAQAVL